MFLFSATIWSSTPSGSVSGPDWPGKGAVAQSEEVSLPAVWMIGTTAGEPPTMPTVPAAKSDHMVARSTLPGLASVSPALTMPFMKLKALRLAAELIW